MQEQKVVFYGAGEHAAQVFHSALKRVAPREVVAFVDGDIYKQGGTYFGLPVVSWVDANKQYGDISVYITADKITMPEIIGFLLESGVNPERIINYETVEKRLGCESIEAQLSICARDEGVISYACCNIHLTGFTRDNQIPHWNLNSKTIEQVYLAGTQIADGIKNGMIIDICQPCKIIKEQYYFSQRKIRMLSLGGDAPCNLRCHNCVLVHNERYLGKKPYSDILKALEMFEKFYGCGEDIDIVFSCGEFSINPDADALLRHLRRYNVAYYTNAYQFSPIVADALRDGKGHINVSIDAGTRETYKLVKGVDGFDRVRDNLYEYAKCGPVVLKYLLFDGMNDTDADLEGFFELADEVAARVVLARDLFKGDNLLSENALYKCAKFIRHFRETKKMGALIGLFREQERIDKILRETANG